MNIEGLEEFICYFVVVMYDMRTCTFNWIFLFYLSCMKFEYYISCMLLLHLIVSERSCLCPSAI